MDLDYFIPIPQLTLPRQLIVWQNLGIWVHISKVAPRNGLKYHQSDSKMFNGNILSTSCASLMKISLVNSEITRVRNTPFWIKWQKSAYFTKYLSNYSMDLLQRFSFGRHVYGNYKTYVCFAVVQGTLLC